MPASNTLYDLVTVLHNKMKGVAAYEQYASDFSDEENVSEVLKTIQQDDERHIEQLQRVLLEALQGQGGSSISGEEGEEGEKGQAEEGSSTLVSRERGQGASSTRSSQRSKASAASESK